MIIKYKYLLVLGIFITLSMVGCTESIDFPEETVDSPDATVNSPDATVNSLTGNVGKGKAVTASVSAYKEDNTLLGTDTNLIDGTYSIPSGDYAGKVRIVANITEYMDEKLNQKITVDGLKLSAISSASSDRRVVNVTPLTEIASRILGESALTDSSVSIQDIADMNIYVAKASGVTDDYNPAKGEVVYLNQGSGEQENTAVNRNGIVLLSISNNSALQNSGGIYLSSNLN